MNKIQVEYDETLQHISLKYYDDRIEHTVVITKKELEEFYYENGLNKVEITGNYLDPWAGYVVDRDYHEWRDSCESDDFKEFLMEYFKYRVYDEWVKKLKSVVFNNGSDLFLVNDDDDAMEELFNGQPNWHGGFYFRDKDGYLSHHIILDGFKKFIDMSKAVYASELVNL